MDSPILLHAIDPEYPAMQSLGRRVRSIAAMKLGKYTACCTNHHTLSVLTILLLRPVNSIEES